MQCRVVFHIDMDAFFASIEQRDHPAWRGKPVIVGAQPGTRGVVSAASYEARTFGVRSAMPISEARRRCPQGIYTRPRMDVYERESGEVMRLLASFSPRIEQVSVDEAFLDMTGTARLLGEPRDAACRLSRLIAGERRLSASIGIAPNKLLAKIASDLDKPGGITLAPFNQAGIEAWLAPMSAGRVWGIGKKTEAALRAGGVATVGDLQALPRERLYTLFGKQGEELWALSRGIDDRPVGEDGTIKSLSREHTFNVDSPDREEWKTTLCSLCQDVARQARHHGVKGRTVVFIYRRTDFSKHTVRKPLVYPSNAAKPLYEGVCSLVDGVREKALRLCGVGITGFEDDAQTNLFAEQRQAQAIDKAEAAVDAIAEKFGSAVIAKGRVMGRRQRRTDRSPAARRKSV
ncbi:MAG: DNA polymerase IV [Chitinispirillaceae bacterium]|nr:DNA polymerase IV [Chitinispirillaceae bacterium]